MESDARGPGSGADDPVVAEIDVVLSNLDPALAMYLVQYPLRPPWRPYDPEELDEVRFKHNHHILEMDYRIVTEKPRDAMDVDVEVEEANGSTRALDAAGNDIKKKLEQHTLRSSAVPLRTNYAIGVYRDSALYVTPLNGIFQMRPSFAKLEDEDEKRRKNIQELEEARQEAGAEFKPVGIHVKRRESERSVAARAKSYQNLKQQENQEHFKHLEFVDRDRDESVSLFEQIASTEGTSAASFDVSRRDYLAMINPVQKHLEQEEIRLMEKERAARQDMLAQSKEKNPSELDLIPKLSSIGAARNLELPMQVKAILLNCGIATFSTLRRLTTATSDAELLRTLEQNCIWVSGRWLLKSETVCRSERLMNARQSLLVTWGQTPDAVISRKHHAYSWRVDPDALKAILLPIADLVPEKGWRLKLESDAQPAAFYPQLENKYRAYWRDLGNSLEKHAENIQLGRESARFHGAADPMYMDAPKLHVDKETANQLQITFRDLLQNHGVLRMDFVRRAIHDKIAAGELPHVPPSIADTILRQELAVVAEPLHDVWVRKCSLQKDDRYRRAIYDLFTAAKDRRIKRRDVETAIVEKTGSTIPRNLYSSIMKELSFVHGSHWALKPGDGTATRSDEAIDANDD